MQTPPLFFFPPLRIAPIFMNDAHNTESDEIYIFHFIFSELCMAGCIYNLRVTHLDFQVIHRPKKEFKSGLTYRQDA